MTCVPLFILPANKKAYSQMFVLHLLAKSLNVMDTPTHGGCLRFGSPSQKDVDSKNVWSD